MQRPIDRRTAAKPVLRRFQCVEDLYWPSGLFPLPFVYVFSAGSARASRAVFGALAEHTVRSAGRRPVQPRRLRSPRSGFQTVVARASRPCVGWTIRTGGTPVPLPSLRPSAHSFLAGRGRKFLVVVSRCALPEG